MIDHVTIKVSEIEKSKKFYEKIFEPLGYKVSFGKKDVFWAFDLGQNLLFEIAKGRDKKLTTTHVAFRAKSKEEVDEFHKVALSAGAKDNGRPGLRKDYAENYYACFVLDPDGHNIETVFYT